MIDITNRLTDGLQWWHSDCKVRVEARKEIERLRALYQDAVERLGERDEELKDVLWNTLTPDDGIPTPPGYTLLQLARDRMSDIERLQSAVIEKNMRMKGLENKIEHLRKEQETCKKTLYTKMYKAQSVASNQATAAKRLAADKIELLKENMRLKDALRDIRGWREIGRDDILTAIQEICDEALGDG